MRIKQVRLQNYKRFTELTIADVPKTAKLVVLVGPNGTGKSSVFDSFLLKARVAVNNQNLSGNMEQYYDKVLQSNTNTTHDVARRIGIEFHGIGKGAVDWKSAFQVRSAYRNESDFRIAQLRATRPEDAQSRIARIIDSDESVSRNYERMVWKRLQDLDRDAPEDITIGAYRRDSLGDLPEGYARPFLGPRPLAAGLRRNPGGFIPVLQGPRRRLPLQKSLQRREGGVRHPTRRVYEAGRGQGVCVLHR